MAAAKEVAVRRARCTVPGRAEENGCEEGLCWESGRQFGGASWQQLLLPPRIVWTSRTQASRRCLHLQL